MFNDLKKKTVIITGGSGFLGSQFVEAFENKNSNIIILDLVKKKYKNQKILQYFCDVRSETSVKNVFTKIIKKFKAVDILINNAAIDHLPKNQKNNNNFENFDLIKWNKELEVGLTGAMICTKIFGKQMARQKKGGVILNISSDLGIIAPNQKLYKKLNFIKPVTYSAIKHGIIGLTKYTASYWGNKKVRCNTLAPGGINQNFEKSFVNKIKKLIPLNRMARKNEYNDLVLFLCSDESSYITGSTIIADGGRSII